MPGDKSIIVSGFSAGLTQPLTQLISEISWRETKMKEGPSARGETWREGGKRKLDLGGGEGKGRKKKRRREREGGRGQLPSKRPPTRSEPPLLSMVHHTAKQIQRA